MLNINKLIGGGKIETLSLRSKDNTSHKQTGMVMSFLTMLCLSAFFVSMPLDAIAKDKKPKTEKKKDKKPKKDKKDKKQEQNDQQTAQPFEVKNETGDKKQL